MSLRITHTATAIFALGIAGCSGGGGGGTTGSAAAGSGGTGNGAVSQSLTDAEATEIAMKLWIDSDLNKHPKGSCSGCHGADFFDLARIGTTSEDVIRRAKIDGATEDEAKALAQAVEFLRADMNMPQTNARTFRPLQPGGQALLPDLDDPRYIASVKRDIAFGQSLEPLLPTLFGAPIDSLAKAEQARDEYLDLLSGTNLAGANPQELSLRELPNGITYPLWSADLHHGTEEGTLNDWIADIARDPEPDTADEWHGLQQAYLDNPSSYNFWKMWLAAEDLTRPQLLGECTLQGTNSAASCGGARHFNLQKFRAALIGQHLMRVDLLSYDPGFTEAPIAFAYLDDTPEFDFMLDRKHKAALPGNMWEIGDVARGMLGSTLKEGTFIENLNDLGFPDFVQNSIDPQRSAGQEEHDLRLAWFWIGFTFDPSLARLNGSFSTKVGEYMIGTLVEENMHMHNTFQAHARMLGQGFLQDANMRAVNRQRELGAFDPAFQMKYSYFIGYGRHEIKWKGSDRGGTGIPANLKAQQSDLWTKFTGNGFRMSLYLYLEAIKAGNVSKLQGTNPISAHFKLYSGAQKDDDLALVQAVRDAGADAGID